MLQAADRGAELAQKLIESQHRIDLELLEQSRLAAEFVKTDFWDYEGSATPYDWIRINCHLNSNTVGDRATVGEWMAKLSESVKAVENREIGFNHLVTMARTAEAVGERFDEALLLKQARETSPGKFFHTCEHYRHASDPKAYANRQWEKYEQRHLRLSRWEDGSLILSGVLDPVGGAAVRSALEPLARSRGWDDNRQLEKRYADALVELTTNGGNLKVNMQVTTSVETLLGLVGAPGAENEFTLPTLPAQPRRGDPSRWSAGLATAA